MADSPDPLRPRSTRQDALEVVRRLREAGQVAYLAGGCVRDMLLGIEPKDFDVATDAPPGRVRELFRNTQAVGAAFGVVLVRIRTSQVEVATFRAEAGYQDGRHPSQVRFTSAEEDARRRDFTINGLFLDPITDQVIDYVGGQADLKARILRAIGNPSERFDEDSLRLLRAVRFAARFAFAIEPTTAMAIGGHAAQLKRISPERIAEELRMMLTPPSRTIAWRMLWELHLIEVIFRFIRIVAPAAEEERQLLFDHLASGQAIAFGLALAAAVVCYRLRRDATLPDVRVLFHKNEVQAAVHAMRQALRISNDEAEQMRGTLASLAPLLADEPPGVAQLKRFLALPTAAYSRSLMDALQRVHVEEQRIQWLRARLQELEKTDYAPTPLIDGDVLTSVGLQPGPKFKRILNAVYDAQLEGRAKTRDEAIALALKIAGE